MTAQLPEVPRLGHQRRNRPPGIDGVSRIARVVLEVRGQLVDLDRRKAGDRDVEAFDHQELREFGQLRRQKLAVPASIFRNLVVGKGKRAALGFREIPHLDCRHLFKAKQLCCGVAAVAGDHDAAFVDQDRHQKSECRDTVGNLADLLLRVRPRVTHIRFDRVDCDPFNRRHDLLL
jgi:hypothetical protein